MINNKKIDYNSFTSYIKNLKKILGDDIKKIPFAIFLTIILSLLEIFSIGIVFPIIALFTKPSLVLDNKFLNFFIGDYKNHIDNDFLILFFSVSLLIIFILKFFLSIVVNAYILNFIYNQNLALKSRLLKVYQNLDFLQYLKKNSSNYINSLNNFVTQVQYSIHAILILVTEIITITFIFLFLLFTTGAKLIIIPVILILIIYVFDKIFKNKLFRIGNLINKYQDNIIKFINEAIFGYKDIRIFKKENFFHKKFYNEAKKFKDLKFKFSLLQILPRPILELIIIIFVIIFILISKFHFNNLESILPILSMYLVSLLRFYPACSKILNHLIYLRNGVASTLAISRDLDLTIFKKDVNLYSNKKDYGKIEFDSLELRNVSFKYPSQDNYLFKNLNIKIQKGSILGISGSSGTGKTTLLNILLGFLKPEKGTLLLNQKEIDNDFNYPTNFFAYLPQDVFLIDDTLSANIALGENELENENFLISIKKAKIDRS